MRKALIVVVVLAVACIASAAVGSAQTTGTGSAASPAPAPAPAKESPKLKARGIVSAVDEATKSFTCHWKAKEWIFKATDKTTYSIGDKPAAWSDVKTREQVFVTYHDDGKDHVADKVIIRPPKNAAPPKGR